MKTNTTNDESTPVEPSTNEPVTVNDEQPLKHPLHKRVHHKLSTDKKLLVAVSLIIVIVLGSAVYWFGLKKDSADKTQVSNTVKTVAKDTTKKSTLPTATVINGDTYFNSPKPLADLGFFQNTDFFGQSCTGPNGTECGPSVLTTDIKYYQIGTTKDNRLIVVFVVSDGPGGTTDFALGNPDGTYQILAQMDSDVAGQTDEYAKSLATKAKVDKTSKINDFSLPVNSTVNNQKLKIDYGDLDGADSLAMEKSVFMANGLISIRGSYFGDLKSGTPQKIGQQGQVTYYRVTASDEDTFQVVEIYGTFNNLFSALYKPAGEIAATTTNLAIKWSAGENNLSTYYSGGSGCGSTGYVLAKDISPADLITVGKSPQGQAIYQLPTSSAIVQEIFNKDYAGGQYLDDASLKNLTIQQMTDKHGYFIAKNGFGEYVLFQRDDLFPHGGCAKPVIYLYPQKTTAVSVAVGAQITKSAPSYAAGGWKNVSAQPNGQLMYNGSKYPNLFWEGYGNGAYPDINSGTIVKTSDLIATVRLQLTQQGLKANEIKDFMDYWMPQLATVNKPYARVTWLNTGQMNQLAPLNIKPAPRTTIRVFMDFEGLDEPYDLPAQQLSAPQRLGFTVVEWGGLLRNGL